MNYKMFLTVLLISALSVSLFAQEQKSVSVTVYNSNLGVVKDTRTINISKGTQNISLTDVAQQIDPTSVHISLDGSVLEQNYQYDLVNMGKILQKYVDKNIQLLGSKGEFIEGKLLSSYGNQIVLSKSDGGLIMIPNADEYQISVESLPGGLITRPTLIWTINSTSSGKQDVEVTYQTQGMNWHAEYVAVLNSDDTALDLNSWVSVENQSGTTYKDAKLKLVAGDVNLVTDRPQPYLTGARKATAYEMADEQFQEQEFFEYHIYNLQRPTTLANNETKQISLFEASNVKAAKKFFYKSGGYYGGTTKGKVAVIVEFKNEKGDGLGVPMPKGKVRVYKSDGDAVEFIGEDLIDHTPNKETVKLKIGDAFDIVVEETQTENKKITNRVYEQTWEIKFKNRKKDDVIIDVERYMGYYWEMLSTSHEFKKKDAQNITFQVPVKADDEAILKFKVRYTY